jgi:hypothetical protein
MSLADAVTLADISGRHFGLKDHPVSAETWATLLKESPFASADPSVLSMVLPILLKGDAHNWLLSQLDIHGKPFRTLDEFLSAFTAKFFGQVRHLSQRIRQQIIDGKFAQKGGQPVDKYRDHLSAAFQRAGDFSLPEQIFWYKHNLHSSIRAACEVQHDGSPWTDISALHNYARGQYTRHLITQRTASTKAVPSAPRFQPGFTPSRSGGTASDRPGTSSQGPPPKRTRQEPVNVQLLPADDTTHWGPGTAPHPGVLQATQGAVRTTNADYVNAQRLRKCPVCRSGGRHAPNCQWPAYLARQPSKQKRDSLASPALQPHPAST